MRISLSVRGGLAGRAILTILYLNYLTVKNNLNLAFLNEKDIDNYRLLTKIS
jgi:hypothetical protein